MIRAAAVLTAIILSTFSLHAQEAQAFRPAFGIKGGLNLSNISNDRADLNDDNYKLGLHFGGFVEAPFNPFIAIRPELLYSMKGNESSYNMTTFAPTVPSGAGTIQFNLHYLEMPVLAVFRLSNNIDIQAGPYVAYLLSANLTNNSNNDSFDNVENLDVGNFERLDWGLATGVSFNVAPIEIGLRYSFGLKNIEKEERAVQLMNNAKNSNFQLSVGFKL